MWLTVLKRNLNQPQKMANNYNTQSRLEKADILELTVMHLRSLEKKQSGSELKQQSTTSMKSTVSTVPTVNDAEQAEPCSSAGVDLKSYRAGYQTCCIDLEHLFEQEEITPLTKERLLHHLQLRIGTQQETSASHSNPTVDVNITPTRLGTSTLNQNQQFLFIFFFFFFNSCFAFLTWNF